MSFKLLVYILVNNNESINITFEEIQNFLLPQDYCFALQKAYEATSRIKTKDDQIFIKGVLSKLSLEILRQGLRQEKNNNYADALLLLKTDLPFLNHKRAEIISNEIKKLENKINEK